MNKEIKTNGFLPTTKKKLREAGICWPLLIRWTGNCENMLKQKDVCYIINRLAGTLEVGRLRVF